MDNKPLKGMAQVRRTISELASGTFIANAQERTRNSKGPWDILGPAIWIPTWIFLSRCGSWLAWQLHVLFYPDHANLKWQFLRALKLTGWPEVSSGLMEAFALPALCLAMMFSNFVLYLLPPAHRDFDRRARLNPLQARPADHRGDAADETSPGARRADAFQQ
jgi:hypothetical protein